MTVKVNMPELEGFQTEEPRSKSGKRKPPKPPEDTGKRKLEKPWDDKALDTDKHSVELPLRKLAGPEWEDEVTDVEKVAVRQRTKPTQLPISRGELRKRPFGELLAEIYRWRADGALLVANTQDKKVIYFRKGRPVFVKSNVLSECLGRILIKEKLITEADCEESLRQMKQSYRQQGTALIEMGRISPHNLVFALGLQLQTKLFDIFGWQDGRFEFDPRAEMPAQPIELEMTTAAIVYEGIKRSYTDGRVSAALRDVRDLYPLPAADPLYRFQELGLDEEEGKLLGTIDGGRTTAQIENKGPLRPMVVRRLLLAMRIAQVLEFDTERRTGRHRIPKLAPPPLDQKAPPVPTPKAPARPAPSRATAEKLAAEVAALRHKNHFEILGISRTAPQHEMRRAYLELAKEYHPDKHYSSASAEVRELAAEIYHLVSVAYETLSEPEDRRRYEAELASGAAHEEEADAVVNVLAAEGKFQRGEQFLRERRFKEAAAAFGEAVALYDEEGEFHAHLGWSLFQANPGSATVLSQALDHIEKAIRLNPKVDKSYLFLGYIHKATGRPDKAERSFEKALQCNPDCLEALHELRLMAKPGRR
jgi:tetratricopeptide (TPR) repeat protein